MTEKKKFRAFRIDSREGNPQGKLTTLRKKDLNSGDVVLALSHSSINYKDALAGMGKGQILRRFPLIGGIDLAGTVVSSKNKAFKPGDDVLMTGSGLSETRDGGYSEFQRVDSKWLIPLPNGLSLKESMILGTAGFTAALSLHRMEQVGLNPEMGPLVVTGATGGVGSIAVDLFTQAGYDVHAISGKTDQFDYLQALGAKQCISRHDIEWGVRPMESAIWAGALDNVGGKMLSALTRVILPWGAIASCGLAGGIDLNTTVMPFIIRGINLLGINSSGCPMEIRRTVWEHLADDWKPAHLDKIHTATASLTELTPHFQSMLKGESLGRTLVEIS